MLVRLRWLCRYSMRDRQTALYFPTAYGPANNIYFSFVSHIYVFYAKFGSHHIFEKHKNNTYEYLPKHKYFRLKRDNHGRFSVSHNLFIIKYTVLVCLQLVWIYCLLPLIPKKCSRFWSVCFCCGYINAQWVLLYIYPGLLHWHLGKWNNPDQCG